MKIEYSHNNSGGRDWLREKDWEALGSAGWDIERYDGTLIKRLNGKPHGASKDFETPADAMREFERLTGQDVSAEGCSCCGPPHGFSWEKGYASGEDCLRILHPDVGHMSLRDAYERADKS